MEKYFHPPPPHPLEKILVRPCGHCWVSVTAYFVLGACEERLSTVRWRLGTPSPVFRQNTWSWKLVTRNWMVSADHLFRWFWWLWWRGDAFGSARVEPWVYFFQIDWGAKGESAQGTMKVLMKSDFSSDLTPFQLSYHHLGAQPNIGRLSPWLGGSGTPIEI